MRFSAWLGADFIACLLARFMLRNRASKDSHMSFPQGLFSRPRTKLAIFASCLVSLWPHVGAQEVSLDPMDIWYRGFLLVQAGEEFQAQGQYLEALNKLTEAKPLFDHLAQKYPDFQTEMVRERRHLIAENRDTMKRLMRENAARPPSAPKQIPQAVPVNPAEGYASVPSPPVGRGASTRNRNIELENPSREVLLPSWEAGSSRALPQRTPGMPTVRTPSPGAVANSIYSDIRDKDETIAFLNEENLELRKELSQRKTVLETVQQQLADAQGERNRLLQQISQAERNGGGLATQQKVQQLKELLGDATEQLQNATDRNAKLVNALADSQRESEKLRNRLAEVERERDNLAEVVRGEGNGGRALKELMDRNRELVAQLDRAEQLASSLSELSKEKNQDIKMLKSEISRIRLERDRLLSENLRHQQSIEDLQRKLELLSDGLTTEEKTSLVSASPFERQENELLRSIVLKQLRKQAQMKEAKELLLKQLDKVGARSDTLLSLVEDMAIGSQLTEEEKALFKAPQFQEIVDAATDMDPTSSDGTKNGGARMSVTLVAPGIGGVRKDGVVKDQKISVELAQLDKSARLDFKEGRYAEAETGFLEYLRYRPRSVSCFCNLGVLKIAVKNYTEAEYFFEKALAVQGDSGLAHYLLGRTYYLQGKLDEALEKLERSLTHDPQNAKAHNTVGVISSQKGWVARAERAFTNAVSIDPKFGDAHFNLAVLYATRDQPDAKSADKHYFEALRLGVPRDATIEEFLKEAETAGATLGSR